MKQLLIKGVLTGLYWMVAYSSAVLANFPELLLQYKGHRHHDASFPLMITTMVSLG